MKWIYSICICICMIMVFLTTGSIKTFFLGLEIGILIGQILYIIKEVIE